ncbi:MAG: tRNA uridine-5-carboxymethylaminomethyl(34) synthesis enzyme MnmG [Clostridia bacterium]|nr:tRNA uridine-5-carboxymethylaminomethyl(34) synthesis enzyme MnmG [Clostridia bacterium]
MEHRIQLAVIGAGHAGIEAALAAARMGVDTVLFTISLDAVANMPCNPSIGGTAKGHLVYEIDALGGEMGRAADAVTLQSRTLNLGKGAAVHSKRIQADRRKYQILMKHTLETTPHLHPMQGEITDILTEEIADGSGRRRVTGVRTSIGETWYCDAAVVCTGTYLDSAIFVGHNTYKAGPDGLLPAAGLSASLRNAGVTLRRFKTGTPPRILRSSVHFEELEEQPGEEVITPYSVYTSAKRLNKIKQISCHIVYTNEETHRIIKENIKKSAMYSGMISGVGPRYCPSIEDKIVRFADKERHQLFLEPLGTDTEEMYLQGFSTSLPPDVQDAMLRTLPGMKDAVITRYAYAIEYDCVDPTELYPTLEHKKIDGLFGAGQFNGTSGYEEAAGQGLVAGINAALKIKGEPPMILKRTDGYIATLIDDLVTKGTNEPYRMMTARSEYRLLLRQDNADARLTPIGYRVGLIDAKRYAKFKAKMRAVEVEKERLEKSFAQSSKLLEFLAAHGMPAKPGYTLADLLRRPQLEYGDLAELDPERPDLSDDIIKTAVCDIKYAGYIKRQLAEVRRQARLEEVRLPEDMDYASIGGLRIEAVQKLTAIKPLTLGQASRISGVSPADISVLLIRMGLK